MKRIFLVRHCAAAGQQPDAPLSEEGVRQSKKMAELLRKFDVEYIVSSPYKRAIESVRPLSEITGVDTAIDHRLRERVLSSKPLDDWMDCLKKSFEDLDMKYEGGESSREAMSRGIQVIEDSIARPEQSIVVASHGGLLSLMIKHFNPNFGFQEWRQLTNPDVFLLKWEDSGLPSVERLVSD
ncbi:histidine phosphatase family protein [Cohnella pontilimi]|uniref:Histidine phosphatase family protein n=1 Tax=Cohnella pontilimi TaxID=2564100 RepID=A0A4U0FGB8_9BACL|nr:histidine phosphatase family protein [Cohnella pontilimi]TJY43951.1 histidine phosphatase family protein [Cohnella pontilimi]